MERQATSPSIRPLLAVTLVTCICAITPGRALASELSARIGSPLTIVADTWHSDEILPSADTVAEARWAPPQDDYVLGESGHIAPQATIPEVLVAPATNAQEVGKKKDHFDILISSYGIIRSDAKELKKKRWHTLVIDEAQNIKNINTAQTKAIKSIGAHNFIAMSGTPVENRLSELWSIVDYSNRGFLGNIKEFNEIYGNPIQQYNDEAVAEKSNFTFSDA